MGAQIYPGGNPENPCGCKCNCPQIVNDTVSRIITRNLPEELARSIGKLIHNCPTMKNIANFCTKKNTIQYCALNADKQLQVETQMHKISKFQESRIYTLTFFKK